MSDAIWDNEHEMAQKIKNEIASICARYNLPSPHINEYARSWELNPILKGLKETEKMLNNIDKKLKELEE